MSSCFNVDVSYEFEDVRDVLVCYFNSEPTNSCYKARKYLPIIAGSGSYQNSTMHTGVGPTNYVSYYVKRIHFEAEYSYTGGDYPDNIRSFPDYAVIFKIPYREPLLSTRFSLLNYFILFSEPEKVLGYDMCSSNSASKSFMPSHSKFTIDVKKPFIVGPNDYVGVFYFISADSGTTVRKLRVQGNASVWFDPV